MSSFHFDISGDNVVVFEDGSWISWLPVWDEPAEAPADDEADPLDGWMEIGYTDADAISDADAVFQ